MVRLIRDILRIRKDASRRHWWLKGLFSYKKWSLLGVYPANPSVDEFIWESLDMGYDLEPDYSVRGWGHSPSQHTVMLNGRRIWIANFPFGSGSYYMNDPALELPNDKSISFYETRVRLQHLVERGLADGTLTARDHTQVKDELYGKYVK